ncbi:MAG: phage shock protein operon transcriptional activator [bacterium]|nr:phage shock protein operon transcriptional activator [Candidatus Sumerlaeota bacterium]
MRLSVPSTDEHRALGESESFLNMQERVSRVAATDRPVILIGERGTGKELAAARLHLLSPRWGQPYVTLNCASLTESLIESELFGHEAGAFTGAVRLRKGRFEIANGGTLFLDEIATLPVTVQEKILRVVEYGQLERVGSSEMRRVDVRLVAAANVDLRALARNGRFRQDLLDRLSFEIITLPSLRRRGADILLLADHFARKMAHEMALDFVPEFSSGACDALMNYPWPGNVRELKNVVERMVYRATGPVMDYIVFDPFESGEPLPPSHEPAQKESGDSAAIASEVNKAPSSSAGLPPELATLALPQAVRALEARRLSLALEECRFNQRKAAARLGITYDQLRNLLRKHKSFVRS